MFRSILQIGCVTIRQPLIQAETCLAQQTRVSILESTNHLRKMSHLTSHTRAEPNQSVQHGLANLLLRHSINLIL